jgi:decaprenylphospho-beta-D-erythro-pentofuranosid-2-ulose 2-reductase
VTRAVAVIGATSGIGRAFVREIARQERDLVLAGRDAHELERLASDARVRYGVRTRVEAFEARAFSAHPDFVRRVVAGVGDGIDGVVVCHGLMPDESEVRRDAEVLREMVDVNYTSAVSILERIAEHFAANGGGWICALSSVAADRGRARNYLYGSTKAALATYLAGLRARHAAHGVSVVTVKPGVVDTSMTFGLSGLPPGASPDRVARDALAAVRRNRPVVYTPWYWWLVMGVVRRIPDRIFVRLSF